VEQRCDAGGDPTTWTWNAEECFRSAKSNRHSDGLTQLGNDEDEREHYRSPTGARPAMKKSHRVYGHVGSEFVAGAFVKGPNRYPLTANR
jgi:hypothetical protein